MRRIIFTFLCFASMVSIAQEYTEGDTLWVNNQREAVEASEATLYGVVKRVDTTANVATIQFFSRETARLISTERRVAKGNGQGLQKGKQLYFTEEGIVSSMEVYTLVHDQGKGKVRNRIAHEIYLYPDGKTQEEVNLTYKTNGYGAEIRCYERKCYYPSGQLQYEEIKDEKSLETTIVYYDEKGKKVKHPKQKILLYEQMPEFPGGQYALFQYLSQNVKYPPIAQENGIQGRVIVQFTVAKDGKIEDVEVVRSGGDPSLDKEAIRVIKAMPRWQPGAIRGKTIRVKYTVPVNFRLM